jgi:ankyrin repeat protein
MQTNSQKSARLISAASRGDLEAVKEYIEHDATLLYIKDDESQGLFPGFTCLHWAARNGHVQVVKYILNQAERQGDPIVNDEDQVGSRQRDNLLYYT